MEIYKSVHTDTVYVLRNSSVGENSTSKGDKTNGRKLTYETIGEFHYNECDIFRVERLWKDVDGQRYFSGHRYLRPHETYRESSHRFYQNEVMHDSLRKSFKIESIMGRCWIMDLNSFCEGRPIDSVESHVYICELHVDRATRQFSKISENLYPVCQNTYAFKRFHQRIKPTEIATVSETSSNDESNKIESVLAFRCDDSDALQPLKQKKEQKNSDMICRPKRISVKHRLGPRLNSSSML